MTEIPLGAIPGHYAETQAPDRVCLTYGETSLTWASFDRRANQWARALADRGVRQDDLVTMALPNGTEFHACAFGLWKLGATPHVVSYRLPALELAGIVALADPRLVVGVDAESLPGRATLAADFTPDEADGDPVPIRTARYWKAMSSGGSTGRPKIIVDHNPSVCDPSDDYLDMPRDACVLSPGPLYHNAPFIFANTALFRGNHLVGLPRFDALETLRMIARHRVRWVMMVPTMMSRIWRLPPDQRDGFDLSSLEIAAHVAAPMPAWLKQEWIDWLGPDRVCELYGGTEATGATWITGSEWLAHKGSVGKAIRGSRIMVLGENGAECPPGQIGEVYLMPEGGPGSTYHYIGAEAKTAAGGWETLGDLGWMDADGYLYLADRRTDMIISGGANIYPAEVESALEEHPAVDTAVAIGLPDDDLGAAVHAIVYPRGGDLGAVDEAALRAFIETRLARAKTPRSYEFVTYSLRDDAGKVRRAQLRDDRVSTD